MGMNEILDKIEIGMLNDKIKEKDKEIERLNNKLNKIKEKIKDLDISKIASRKELITPFIVNVLDIISEDEMSDKDE